jgi:hypothetical protein
LSCGVFRALTSSLIWYSLVTATFFVDVALDCA